MKESKLERGPYKGEKFKTNQIVICINNKHEEFYSISKSHSWNDKGSEFLELNKQYRVSRFTTKSNRDVVYVFLDNKDEEDWFYPERFIGLNTLRKRKIKKLNGKILHKLSDFLW